MVFNFLYFFFIGILREEPLHFSVNKLLIKIVTPIIDCIGRLEHDSSNVGDVWPNFIIMRKQISSVVMDNIFESFKIYTLNTLDKYSKNYEGKKKKKLFLFL